MTKRYPSANVTQKTSLPAESRKEVEDYRETSKQFHLYRHPKTR